VSDAYDENKMSKSQRSIIIHNSNPVEKAETLLEFYKRKFNWLPENIKNEIGHFNLFQHEPITEGAPTGIPW
jgi:hypothetical protein